MVLRHGRAGTERLSEADLVPLITREALIAVADVRPSTAAAR